MDAKRRRGVGSLLSMVRGVVSGRLTAWSPLRIGTADAIWRTDWRVKRTMRNGVRTAVRTAARASISIFTNPPVCRSKGSSWSVWAAPVS